MFRVLPEDDVDQVRQNISPYSVVTCGVVGWCWVNFQCRGVLLIWIMVGQVPTALAVGAGGGCLNILDRADKY